MNLLRIVETINSMEIEDRKDNILDKLLKCINENSKVIASHQNLTRSVIKKVRKISVFYPKLRGSCEKVLISLVPTLCIMITNRNLQCSRDTGNNFSLCSQHKEKISRLQTVMLETSFLDRNTVILIISFLLNSPSTNVAHKS